MKSFFALLLICILCEALPPRPNISETFEIKGAMSVQVPNGPILRGEAFWAVDQPSARGVEIFRFKAYPQTDIYLLQRYDLHTLYDMGGANRSECAHHPLSGDMPEVWDWVSRANYSGQQQVHDRYLNIWQSNEGFGIVQFGVSDDQPNIPVWISRTSHNRVFSIWINDWKERVVHKDVFDVPKQCQVDQLEPQQNQQRSQQKRCVSRSTSISRAKVWVSNHVPYNQQGHYQGYREDCSGYVSMAWELGKPGLTTFTLPTVSHRISKEQLQPGDVLLDVQEHVVIFNGWADSSHSQYHAMEETRPGEGTVARVTPYPYWYNKSAFVPYRYNHIC